MHASYVPSVIQEILSCRSDIRDNHADIQYLLIDSRKIIQAAQSVFIALKAKRDGHLFIEDIYAEGVRNFIVSDSYAGNKKLSDANFYYVSDTLQALQSLASTHRLKFTFPVIGITGSNGKTIVKDWLFQLLSPEYYIVRSPKSYNSQIGVPVSVWLMNEHHQLGIFEAGISTSGEMKNLQKIIQPTIGILTNIKAAHDDGFDNRKEKLIEKLKLFESSELTILPLDYLEDIPVPENAFTWSMKRQADLQVTEVERKNRGYFVQALFRSEYIYLDIPFTDEASLENIIICWAVMLSLGYEHELIAERMQSLHALPMRLELRQGINDCSVINDSYSADISSLFIAVDFLNQQQQHLKKTVILSDINHPDQLEIYPLIAAYLLKNNVTRIIGIGKEISEHAMYFMMDKVFYPDTESFLNDIHSISFSNETILIKGARSFAFERIGKLLEQKVHETILEINLNALIHNVNVYRSFLKPTTKIMAMVKAFSYGSGSFEIANLLQYNKIDYLAVAFADEGVELRKAGIELPIMVMNPEPLSFTQIVRYHLEPELYNFRVYDAFVEYLKGKGLSDYKVHLKLDTGMHRLGFEAKHIQALCERIQKDKPVKVSSVFSHLAASEDQAQDSYTRQQIKLFSEMSDQLRSVIGYDFIKHISNTAAILRFPDAQFDMVRLGIGMYGIDYTGDFKSQLEETVMLKTTVTQIKELKAGETVGYGRKAVLQKDSQIATVKIGYADGYSRSFGNGIGYMLINGAKCKVVGNVCMDMCMLDVSGLNIREGMEVAVFGAGIDINEMAASINTISYEILSNISQRVKRIYYYE